MHTDRRLSPSAFPGDDGQATRATRDRLAASAAEPAGTRAYLSAVAALGGDRILVPVVATATKTGTTTGGLTSDKEAEMAVVSITGPDGRRGLLGFTGLDALHAWDPGARPVPVTLDVAAQATLSDGATALVIDVAGPYALVIEGEILAALGVGQRLVELDDATFGWAMVAPVEAEQAPS